MAGKTNDKIFHSLDASDVMVEEGGSTLQESVLNKEQNDMIEDPVGEPRELSELEKRRVEKIKRNIQRFEELGLMNSHKCLNDAAMPQENVMWNKTV